MQYLALLCVAAACVCFWMAYKIQKKRDAYDRNQRISILIRKFNGGQATEAEKCQLFNFEDRGLVTIVPVVQTREKRFASRAYLSSLALDDVLY